MKNKLLILYAFGWVPDEHLYKTRFFAKSRKPVRGDDVYSP